MTPTIFAPLGPETTCTHILQLVWGVSGRDNIGPVHRDRTAYVYLNIPTDGGTDGRVTSVVRGGPMVSYGFPDLAVKQLADGATLLVPTGHAPNEYPNPDPYACRSRLRLTRQPNPDDDIDALDFHTRLFVSELYINPKQQRADLPLFALLVERNGRLRMIDQATYYEWGLDVAPLAPTASPVQGLRGHLAADDNAME